MKKRASKKQPTIKVENISGISGSVNIAGGNITTHQTMTGLSVAEIESLFNKSYNAIESRAETSLAEKENLKAEVQEIQSMIIDAAKKNEKVDERFLSHHFRNIARMAPDILEVVAATLANPALGIGLTVKKIAEKAKEEIR